MRVKIKLKEQEHGIKGLTFGKKYFIAYLATSHGNEFVFTRKNRIELCEYQEKEGKRVKVSSFWISKKQLKQMINSGPVIWVSEVKEEVAK